MIKFQFLDKQQKDKWLPILFDLLYENMCVIAPSNATYEQQKYEWMTEVSPAIDKAPRQIIMVFVEDNLAGYVQYYTRDRLLMIEEVQLKREYHRTRLFYKMCKHLIDVLPDGIENVEAYADKRNLNSRSIMKNLGMKEIKEDEGSPFAHLVHLRGCAQYIKNEKLLRH